MILLTLFTAGSCVVPAAVGPGGTGLALATTNCIACTMTLVTRYDSITFDFPDPKDKLRFKYLSDSVTTVKIYVKPLSDQAFNVRVFDKDNIQVYLAPEVTAKAGSINNYTYTFKLKK